MPEADDAGDAKDADARRHRNGAAEAVAPPTGPVVSEEVAGAIGEAQELAHIGHAVEQEPAATCRREQHHAQPGRQLAARVAREATRTNGAVVDGHVLLLARPQVRRQPRTAADLEADDLSVGHLAQPCDLSPATDDRADARDESKRRAQGGERLAEAPGEQTDDELQQRQQQHLHEHEGQAQTAGERGHTAHALACGQRAMVQIRAADRQGLEMASPCGRHHHHSRPTEMRPPAQVDVFAVERGGLIEATERSEQIGSHEDARRGQCEHVAYRVVLLLVGLARFDQWVDLAEAVDTEADVLEDVRTAPHHQLRADDAGVRAVQLLDEQAHRSGIERHVVVHQHEESVVALDEA